MTGSGIDRQNPWPGLQSFEERDSAFFFGRDSEIDELFRTVKRETATLLYGLSGLGKTSLLKAGLLPVLRKNGFLSIEVRLDYGRSGPGVLVQQIFEAVRAATLRERVEAEPPRTDDTLWEYFHREPFWDERNNLVTPVLVIDQFEEVFTLGEGHDGVEPLLIELADLIENRIPERLRRSGAPLPASYDRPKMKVLVAMREDFLPNADELMRLTPSLVQNRFRLHQLRIDQALRAVLEPGREVISEAVAAEVVAFVAGGRAKDRVEPSLLSLVCRELNQRRREAALERISSELLEGERDRVVSDFYERTTRDAGLLLQHFVEDRLLTSDGFRTTVAIQDALGAPGVTREGIDRLVDVRLLRLEERLGLRHVEIVHDVLARVAKDARDHRLEVQARRRRRRRQIFVSVAVALVALLVTGAWSYWSVQQRETRDELNRKNAELYTELGRRESLDGDPARAVTYLAAAHRARPDVETTEFLLKRAAQTFQRLEVKSLRPSEGKNTPSFVRLSDDGQTALAAWRDGSMDLWWNDGEQEKAPAGLRLAEHGACFDQGVLTTIRSGPDDVVVVTRGTARSVFKGRVLATSADCHWVAVGGDAQLLLVDTVVGKTVATLLVDSGVFDFTPDGNTLVRRQGTRRIQKDLPNILSVEVAHASDWQRGFERLLRTSGCPRLTNQWPQGEWNPHSVAFTDDSSGYLLRDGLVDLSTGACSTGGVLRCGGHLLQRCTYGPAFDETLPPGVISRDVRDKRRVALGSDGVLRVESELGDVQWTAQAGAHATALAFVDDETVLVKGDTWLETYANGQMRGRADLGLLGEVDLQGGVLRVELAGNLLFFDARTLHQLARAVHREGGVLDAQVTNEGARVLRTSAAEASLGAFDGGVLASVELEQIALSGAVARAADRAVVCSASSCTTFGVGSPRQVFEGHDGVLSPSGRYVVMATEEGTRVCDVTSAICTLVPGVTFERESMMRADEPLAALQAAGAGSEVLGVAGGDAGLVVARGADVQLRAAAQTIRCSWKERARFRLDEDGAVLWKLTIDGLSLHEAGSCATTASVSRAFQAVRSFDVARGRALIATARGVFLVRPARADARFVLPIQGELEASEFDDAWTYGFWRVARAEVGTLAVVDARGQVKASIEARDVARGFASKERLAYFDRAGALVVRSLGGQQVTVPGASDPASTVLFDEGRQLLTRLSDASGTYLTLFRVEDPLRLERSHVFPPEATLASVSSGTPLIHSGQRWWVGGKTLRDEVFSMWELAWEENGCGSKDDFQFPDDQFATASPLEGPKGKLVFLAQDGRHFASLSKSMFDSWDSCNQPRSYWFRGVVPVKGLAPQLLDGFWFDRNGALSAFAGGEATVPWSSERRFESFDVESRFEQLRWLLTGGRELPLELRDETGRLLERFGVTGEFRKAGETIRYAADDGVVGRLELSLRSLTEAQIDDVSSATGLNVSEERPAVLTR